MEVLVGCRVALRPLVKCRAVLETLRSFVVKPPHKFAAGTRAVEEAPLAGIRVLDLTRVLAGPFCTMSLGDLGAEVIKIERPGYGDETRTWVPPMVNDESAYFLSINRNKKSVVLNLKKPTGQDLARKLAQMSDIVVENYLPGTLGEMRLGYEDLIEINPRLIYCSITGYGQTGPNHRRTGYDIVLAATAGLVNITGPERGEPCCSAVAMTDLTTGLFAKSAIMAALLSRQKTNKGQHIDCNLLSSQVAILSHLGSNYLNKGVEARRLGTAHHSIVPYQAFATKDDYIIIAIGNNVHFRKLCHRMDLKELSEDPRYEDNSLRVKNRNSLLATLKSRFQEHDTAYWLKAFEGSGIPYGPINSIGQVFNEPQVIHNEMIQTMEHPTAGTIKVPGPAVRYSETPTVLQCPPPILGQHTVEVLRDLLGQSDDNIQQLQQEGVIELATPD